MNATATHRAAPLQIAIVSDVVCPWCYIGKRQLEEALAQRAASHPGEPAPQLRWFPFQLNPDMPAAGMDRGEYLRGKFGSSNLGEIYARVQAAADTVGLNLHLERVQRQPNTLKSHALINLAAEAGLQTAMAHALFRAYFEDGQDLTQDAVLRELAQACGLNDEIIDGALNEEQVHERIARADQDLRAQGVSGVPLFVFSRPESGQQSVISGAQGTPALLAAMAECDLPAAG